MSRVENALQAIYEDPGLRDELQDAEAEKLLKWAEAELTRLDASGADDAAFDEKMSELRRLLKGMNRLVGRRDQIGAQASDDALDKLAANANALGYALTPDHLAAFAREGASLDGISAVERLTTLISQTEAPAQSHDQPPVEAQAADASADAPAEAPSDAEQQPTLTDASYWDAGMMPFYTSFTEADTEDNPHDSTE